MTFTWIGKQGARSSDGFEVQSVDRFSIEYREGGQIVTVPVDHGTIGATPCVIISAKAFEHWDNYRPPNSQEKQAKMLANFKAAMEFQGMAVDV